MKLSLAFGAAIGVALVSSIFVEPACSANSASPIKVVISYSEKAPDFLPIWIANDAGYFKKQGLDATVRYLPAQEGIPALIAGQVQIAGVGGSDGLSAVAQGAKLKLIAALTPVYNFQFWAQRKYANAAALKGQRIGITSSTGSLYAATLLALKELGLKASDVSMTPLGSVTNVNSALLAGSVVAAASHPPTTYQFQRAGLVDMVDLAKRKIPSVSAGVWVYQPFASAHRDVVQRVANAIVEGADREKSDPKLAESEIAKYLGVKDKGEVAFTYNFYRDEVLAKTLLPNVDQLKSNVDAMALSNPKIRNVNVDDVLDQSFIKAATR